MITDLMIKWALHREQPRMQLTRSDLLVLAAALDHALKTGGPFKHPEDWEHACMVENKLDRLIDACDRGETCG